ncbi:MAG TPA: protein translocase subunit SecD [Tepidisphaeraceae bacterium]|nr:protein translocase subunit SecD [Tepidisphaeraceae bacterium]
MPTNYANRFFLIALVVLGALWCIFPGALAGRFRPALKPGIDMVGGTSLLYEIKAPEGGVATRGTLAEEVMGALKKRVDPDGVRNLIWRPQGSTRLEIQMPLTAASGESGKRRAAFAEAQAKLESTNVRTGEVLRAVETLGADARRDRLNQLAMGSEARGKLFGALVSTWDQLKAAREQKNAAVQAEKELQYDQLKGQIEETNVSAQALEQSLSGPDGQKRLEELKQKYAGFPPRLAALDGFARANVDYQAVKGSLDDANDLKRLLRGSGVLEFHILAEYDPANPPPAVREMIDRLLKRGPVVQAGDTMRWYAADQPEEFTGSTIAYNGRHYVLAYTTPDKAMFNQPGRASWALASARPDNDQNSGARIVNFLFDPQGAKYFGDLTGANVNQRLGIVLDDRMISAPNINVAIRGGAGYIEGNRGGGGFSEKEQSYLVSMLGAGSLPAKLTDEPISERTVGPQIGKDNLRAGLIACAFGLVVVGVFLIGYYYLSGVVAFVAVLLNMVLILGFMAGLNATFTLAGVAGIVLTIGMAVDANVLIFERLREEQQRGLSLRMALRNAYDRAWSAILDGNVTTGITAFALYMFGSEEVKGFGLTLLLGICASLFTSLYVTKTIFGVLIDKFGVTQLGSLPLTYPNWDRMLRPNIDWMGKAWAFYAFSIGFILIGLVAFGWKLAQGKMMDIEFASGTSVQFELVEPMRIEEVRKVMENAERASPDALPAPSVVSVGTDDRSYEVVTPNKDAVAVKKAVLASMGNRLKLDLPSRFVAANAGYEQAVDKQVFPVTSENQAFPGAPVAPQPQELAQHLGGVAVVLNDIQPPLSPTQIRERFERARIQPQAGQAMQPYREFTVLAPEGAKPTDAVASAVVLVSDPAFPFEKDPAKWAQELAQPVWRLVNEGVAGEASLQKVVNFDAQVASETQREATIALILSILGIMAYIWLRFGNLKYGTATVVALAHDTLFVIAAVGIAHFLSDWGIGRALLIEPFRINLTMVAAILTVMGYSMNDTVVIFDRIRENRGKFGVANRRVINDSINQTLSRTLLTGGTTILTILVMYVWGGPGIHGFTYALLLGILVGTYSSIAIASPILLLGREQEATDAARGKAPAPVGQLQRA